VGWTTPDRPHPPLSRPSDTLSPAPSGGEGWGEGARGLVVNVGDFSVCRFTLLVAELTQYHTSVFVSTHSALGLAIRILHVSVVSGRRTDKTPSWGNRPFLRPAIFPSSLTTRAHRSSVSTLCFAYSLLSDNNHTGELLAITCRLPPIGKSDPKLRSVKRADAFCARHLVGCRWACRWTESSSEK
jgi:hypothetical protein